MKAVVAAFNQEKALVGAFSVITNLRMELFGALLATSQQPRIQTKVGVKLPDGIYTQLTEATGVGGST